jgi:F0F1-type ATP synthase delta subunit
MSATAQQLATELISLLKKDELYDLLPELTKELEQEVYRNHDIHVISAVELPKSELEDITALVTKKWGEHRIVISVDPTLVSGILITFQDRIIDLSGSSTLSALKHDLS